MKYWQNISQLNENNFFLKTKIDSSSSQQHKSLQTQSSAYLFVLAQNMPLKDLFVGGWSFKLRLVQPRDHQGQLQILHFLQAHLKKENIYFRYTQSKFEDHLSTVQ